MKVDEKGRLMPLDKSGSNKSIGKNIATEERAGKPRDQAIAIAEAVKRRAAAKKRAKRS